MSRITRDPDDRVFRTLEDILRRLRALEGPPAPEAAWTPYTPALTGSGSNPNLGNGSSVVGAYQQVGRIVTVRVGITFGASGVSAGSGTYQVSVPVDIQANDEVVGFGYIFDASAVNVTLVTATRNAAGRVDMAAEGIPLLVTHNSPFTFAATDNISLKLIYEAA